MKQPLTRIVTILLLLTLLISCESMMSNNVAFAGTTMTKSSASAQSPQMESSVGEVSDKTKDTSSASLESLQSHDRRFLGTWKYSNMSFGAKLEEIFAQEMPMPVTFELSLTFFPDHTGFLTIGASTPEDTLEGPIDIVWSSSSYSNTVLVALKNNTAVHFSIWYENEVFLSANDQNLGIMYFAKQ
ncbi:MAG: hypothetical protein M0R76_14425 [Proteobacteria bacterium]|nr:hypothetical protein [Pseudomonadota bacterium]